MGDEEPGTSPMGAQDMAASAAYYEQADVLHSQATVEESMADVMDVMGLGGEMHKQAAEHENAADDADTRGWRMYTAAQERDWAHEAREELADLDRRQELAQVKERTAVDGLGKDGLSEHEQTNLEVQRESAHAELSTLQRREEFLEKVEVNFENTAIESERLAREGEPSEPADSSAAGGVSQ